MFNKETNTYLEEKHAIVQKKHQSPFIDFVKENTNIWNNVQPIQTTDTIYKLCSNELLVDYIDKLSSSGALNQILEIF